MPKVAYCCCGCSLRDGTVILLGLDIVFCFICLLFGSGAGVPYFLLNAAMMAVAGAGLYGIFKEKPDFIIAHMIVQILGFIIIVGIMVLVLFGGATMVVGIANIAENIPGSKGKTDFAGLSFSIILLIELIFGLAAGLQYYFFVVVYSLYTEMRAGSTSAGHF